jgi:hypothetical protein
MPIRADLAKPIDPAPLIYFRITFGMIMLWEIIRYATSNWIYRYYIKPQMFFPYLGFDRVHPLPGNGMYLVFFALGLLAICIIVGFCYRLAMPLFCLIFSYVFLLDQSQYLNHFYLVILLSGLMSFIPAHCAFSIDARVRPDVRMLPIRLWMLRMLQFQIVVVYAAGALAKLNGDWLQGEPMRLWLAQSTDFPVIGQYFTQPWAAYVFSYGGLMVDALALPFFCWRRTRWIGLVILVSFHLLNSRLFAIGIFPWLMLATLPLFLPLAWWNRIASRFANPIPDATIQPRLARITVSLLALYCVVQIVLPLRHFLIPGDVSWTEEGGYFAWQMKLRDKQGIASFRVHDPVSGKDWTVNPRDYLTHRQYEFMTDIPDMILLFSHHLADRWLDQGYPDVEVYALVLVSLNGREYRPIVDGSVNLAAQPRTLPPASWIKPLDLPLSQSRSKPDS